MNNQFDFKKIEEKWTKKWQTSSRGGAEDFSEKSKHYHLVEFPYPSGAGLHVGHCMGYGASDAYCRMKRMQGFNVMFPIGWDAFGLPTENFAIKNKIKPQKATADNVANFKKQMEMIGLSFDWDREINTTDPDYYRWTQWIFLQFYKHSVDSNGKLIEIADDDVVTPRLAYQAEMPINWCPSCKIGLANEEVVNGKCERCGTETIKKMQKQWMLRITAYAERLISDLDKVDYLPKIKTSQTNWIGRSTGTNIKFKVVSSKLEVNESLRDDYFIDVFTTRADTLFGCTYVVLAPENPLLENLKFQIQNLKDVEEYIQASRNKSDLERTELQKDKTGIKLEGVKAINPINNTEVEVWVADYVLASYGTGAVMAVPAHDERDWEFAKKYGIPIIEVIKPVIGKKHEDSERRNTVQAIVRDKEGKYLALKWNEFDWISFPLGGIDDGESPEEAVVREVAEETGYKIKPIERIGGIVESHFYAVNKKVWRERHDQAILCELLDETPGSVSDDEKNRHEPIWMTPEELFLKITHKDNLIGLQRLLKNNYAFIDYGILINSEKFNGITSEEAKKKITEKLKEMGAGDFTVNYKLRDWIFSRQHYWGEPIPIVYCRKCWENAKINDENSKLWNVSILDDQEHMIIPVPEDQLPVTLPDVEHYEPTDTGESPLAAIDSWVNTTCPKCGGKAKRETDTMPNWAGSSWYFLRYCDPRNNKELASMEKLNYWMGESADAGSAPRSSKSGGGVDIYNGGMEHTNLHLLYSRFWHKFLFDLGATPEPEPYQKRIAHGIILGPDGRKMSKSFGNVINPDDIVKQFGADTLRAYIMFIGPYDQESAWSMAGVQGVFRFMNRIWKNQSLVKKDHADSKELLVKLNQTIAGVGDDIENFRLNTVVSKLMELNHVIEREKAISTQSYEKFIKILFPVAPFISSEIWENLGNGEVESTNWPEVDQNYLVLDQVEIVVQVNGKVRDKFQVEATISDEELKAKALLSERIKGAIEGKEIIKIIIVPQKLVSIVAKAPDNLPES